MSAEDEIWVTYSIKFPDDVKSEEVYKLAKDMADNMSIGFGPFASRINWQSIGIQPRELSQIEKDCGSTARVEYYDEEEKYGLIKLKLKLRNFDIAYGEIPLLLGVIAGDVLGLRLARGRRLKGIKIISLEIGSSFLDKFNGPKVGLEGLDNIFGLGKQPLLAFSVKPRLGLDPDQFSRLCGLAAEGGADIVEDDERLVNPVYCNLKDRLEKTLVAVKEAEQKTGRKKIYSINLTGRADKIVSMFEELDKMIRKKVPEGLECIKIDVLPAGFSALRSISEHFHDTGRDIIITVYPSMYTLYEGTFADKAPILLLSRLGGADIIYAGSPIIIDRASGRIDTDILSRVKRHYYDEVLWEQSKMNKFKKCMPTVTGGVDPGTIELFYRYLGSDIGFFIGSAIIGYPDGPLKGAQICRQAIEAAVAKKPLYEYIAGGDMKKLAEAGMNYFSVEEIIKNNPKDREYLSIQ